MTDNAYLVFIHQKDGVAYNPAAKRALFRSAESAHDFKAKFPNWNVSYYAPTALKAQQRTA